MRFNQVAKFAKTFGLNIRLLAEFVAQTGIGIEPWLDEVDACGESTRLAGAMVMMPFHD